MTSEIEGFIQKTALKDAELLAGIFKSLVNKYPDETRRQHAIRGTIMLYEEQYAPEIKRHDKDMKRFKESRNNEFSSEDTNQMRIAFRLPDSLVTRINMILNPPIFPEGEPLFLSDEASKKYDEDTWFRENFPRYVAADKY